MTHVHEVHEWHRDRFTISTDPARLDLATIHRFLASSYWASGIALDTVRCSIEHSLPFGLYHNAPLIGFARIITDYATFAYMADVFVLPEHRGQGLAKWLVETMLAHPELTSLRSWTLRTRDAQELYRRFGFEDTAPGQFLRRPGGGARTR